MAKNVLIVDDESSIRQTLTAALQDEGYQVQSAQNGAEALAITEKSGPDLVLLDIWMPGVDGIEVLKRIKELRTDTVVIMMSGHGTIETAVRATKLGAFDFIEKPLSLERLLVLLQNARSTQDLARENTALRRQLQKERTLIGDSSVMQQARDIIKRVAPTTGSVLITGENGTGKELIAHAIHTHSPRFNKPFIEVNCAAIPEELIESELFGHEKGSFTGATGQKKGKFDLANGGTLFLDEIGDMSFKTQAKILRILQEQKFERVGGNQTIQTDVRVLAATNKDLKQAIKNGSFREDLYHRLNVIPFYLQPLRDRKGDTEQLALHFLKEFSNTHGKPVRPLTKEALAALNSYSWPGNVRELRNMIERIVILTPEADFNNSVLASEVLQFLTDQFMTESSEATTPPGFSTDLKTLRDARDAFEKVFIQKSLEENSWNVSKTAQTLGIERSHLHKKIKAYGLE
ncbi:MAG: sigma-54-dependent Fis family transcriptional regulator [Xanthomonadaceae bacterium]|nr:sigma-54-dependent Fis family transcriptional regulator [Xanthomonadaceae bacterium]